MHAAEIVRELEARGVELRAEGGKLKFRPGEAVSPELREALVANKPEILRLLVEDGRYVRPAPEGECSGCRDLRQQGRRVQACGRCDVLVSGALAPEPAEQTVLAEEVLKMALSEFARAGLRLLVRSKVLGETVLFCSDNALITDENRREHVVYRARELRELIGLSPAALRRVHEVKRVFNGSISIEAN